METEGPFQTLHIFVFINNCTYNIFLRGMGFTGHINHKFRFHKINLRGLRSSATLRSVFWCLLTDASGQPIRPICKGHAVPDGLNYTAAEARNPANYSAMQMLHFAQTYFLNVLLTVHPDISVQ